MIMTSASFQDGPVNVNAGVPAESAPGVVRCCFCYPISCFLPVPLYLLSLNMNMT